MQHLKINSTLKFILLAVLLLVLMSVPMSVFAGHGGSSSSELSVVGHLDLAGLGIPGGENVTDVWAFGDYAYLGTFDDIVCSLDFTGVHIVDISDPSDPTKVAFIPAKPGSRNNDVKVEHIDTEHFTGEILVASNEPCNSPFLPRLNSNGVGSPPGQGGVAIWDVTNPTKPKALRQNFLEFGVHNTFIYQQGANAYMLVVDDENIQDVHIVDITKPQSPEVIAVTGQQDWPADIVNIENGAAFLHDVWVQENDNKVIAYLSYWDAGLVLLDITDPANPAFLGDSDYQNPDPLSGKPVEGNSHVAAPTEDGKIVFMGDEDFAPSFIDTFTFEGTDYPAAEGGFTKRITLLPGEAMTGPVFFIDEPDANGFGCNGDPFRPAESSDEIALIQRGVCRFDEKAQNAIDAGYAGFIVFNDAARGDTLVGMSGNFRDIPGVFVGHSTGLIMRDTPGGTVFAHATFDGWGYTRVLDVSNPDNIVELGQFATENVFVDPPPSGDRTAHNVIVRNGLAYWSWYAEGMRVVDFSACKVGGKANSCTKKINEVAHFVDTANGSNFWGVYLHDHSDGNTYILGSDRNTGLWIFDTP